MRIGFYNPYFDGFGGGERYTLTLASHWSKDHKVELFWDDPLILKGAKTRFNIDLSRIRITQNIFRGKNLLRKLYLSRMYDLIFFLSDGSIPTSFAKRNILHFQVPFSKVENNPFKINRFQAIVCNSQFTKNNLDPRLRERATVIYPPVKSVAVPKTPKKENVILSIGRFTSFHNVKKQIDMIEAFIKIEQAIPGWRLILAGGLMINDEEYFKKLKKLSDGHHITLLKNITYKQLTDLYGKSKIYWHSTGLNETDPKLMEHFGISTVEAMSTGAIPIVYGGGGQLEIIHSGRDGYVWHTRDELLQYTLLVASHENRNMQEHTRERAKEFSEERFFRAFDSLLEKIILK